MYNPKEFDEDFYKSITGKKGGNRSLNISTYVHFSNRLKDAFKDTDCHTILDIGAGLGIRTKNHITNGFDAYPCDVSEWAYNNSHIKWKHYLADVRDLTSIKPKFDIVIAERILGYIPPEDSLKALEQIDSKAEKYLVFSIICSDHIDQVNVVAKAKPLRKNIQPRSFWLDLFSHFKWELDAAKTRCFLKDDWDCIWVMKKLMMSCLMYNFLDIIEVF